MLSNTVPIPAKVLTLFRLTYYCVVKLLYAQLIMFAGFLYDQPGSTVMLAQFGAYICNRCSNASQGISEVQLVWE